MKKQDEQSETEQSQTLISRDEMNLAEFPFTALSEKIAQGIKTLVFTDTIIGDKGKLVKRTWTVTGSDKYGLPRGRDLDVLHALLKITQNYNFEKKINNFTLSEVIRIMKWEDFGRNYKRVEQALDRLSSVHIKAENAFWDNEKKAYLTIGFGILDNYQLWKDKEKRGRKSMKQEYLPLSSFTWGDIIFRSFQKGYLKPIDLTLLYSLKSTISKRLFQYLDKKKYKKLRFEIDIFVLAFEKIGLSKNYYLSDIKRKLDVAHQELIENGYLKSATYEPTADGKGCKVVYCFMPKGEQRKVPEEVKQLPQPQASVLNDLLKEGVEQVKAEELVKTYSEEQIRIQLEALAYRKVDKSKTGVLIKSIEENWSMPEELARIEKQRQEREEEKRKAEETRKEEKLFRQFLKEVATELEHLKTGTRKAEYEQIEKEVEESILSSFSHLSPREREERRKSEMFQTMLKGILRQRLEKEGLLTSYAEWKKSHPHK